MELPSPPLVLEPSGCPRRREIEATAPASTSLLQSSSPDVLMSWHCSAPLLTTAAAVTAAAAAIAAKHTR
jgi:hypothetical protein